MVAHHQLGRARAVSALLLKAVLVVGITMFATQCAFAQTVDSTTLADKLVCGYQGWFACPGDGNDPAVGWMHWTNDAGEPRPGYYHTDMWPDVNEYDPGDLFYCQYTTLGSGNPAYLFSSAKQGVTDTHFRWMQEQMIDGVFLQRYTCETPGDPNYPWQRFRDTVLQHVMNSAVTYGRVFIVEYDITNTQESELYSRITTDWTYLKNTFYIKTHGRYLRHNGKPVVMIWGLGFHDRPGTASIAQDIIDWFKNDGCFVIGGVPWGWRTLTGDSKTDPAWASVYRSLDGLSSWMVGAYSDWNGILWYKNNVWVPDLQECNNYGIRYMPTAWPRLGVDNMNSYPCGTSKISPRGGQQIWDQFYVMTDIGCHNIFVAMFDEYDESTAIMKMSDDVPTSGCWWTNEGKPKDWHLALTNYGSKMFKGQISLSQTIPISPSNAADNAAIVGDTIPTEMTPGGQYNVSVTVQNTGGSCWNSRDYWRLGAVNDSDPFIVGCRAYMSQGTTVMPGQQYTFNFTMTAPTQTGQYTTDWQMVHEATRWFGEQLVVQVDVGIGGAADRLFYNLSSAGATGYSDRMTKPSVSDGDTTPNTVGGRTGHRNVDPGNDYYFYFAVDDGWAYQGSRPDVYVMVTYYDSGTGSLVLQYDSISGGPYKNGPSVSFTNTNTWKKATLHITDAYFGNRENSGADFRFFIGTGVTRTLDLIEVSNVANPAPSPISDDLGNPDVEDGLFRVVVSDGDTTPVTKGGRACRKNVDPNNDYYFYFDAGSQFCLEGSNPDLYITLDYYDTGGGWITLNYDSAGGGYYKNGGSVAVGWTNTWKTHTWHVTDAYFANRENNGADFRFFLGVGTTRWLDTVSVSTQAP